MTLQSEIMATGETPYQKITRHLATSWVVWKGPEIFFGCEKLFISENSALILMDPNKKAENRGHMLALFSTSAPLMLTNGLIGP